MFGKKKKEEELRAQKEERARQKYEENKKAEREQLAAYYKYAREYDRLRESGLSDDEARQKLDSKRNEIEVEIASSTNQNLVTQKDEKEVVTKNEEVRELTNEDFTEQEEKTVVKRTKVNEKVIYETKPVDEEETKEELKEETIVSENNLNTEKKNVEDSNIKVLSEQDPNDKVNGKYEIFQDSDGFKYRLVASNGQVMATSEVYTTIRGAQNGIETLKSNKDTLITRIETDKHKKSQFVGLTVQNKVLIHSANYPSRTQADSAITSVKNLIPATKVVLIKTMSESKPELVDRSKFIQEAAKGKYIIVADAQSNAYQFVLKASNGQVILTSKQYKSVLSCKGAITKFRNEVKNGTFYTVKDKNGQYQFRLYSQANKLVQSGISYSTKAKCISNIESICRFIDSDIIEK